MLRVVLPGRVLELEHLVLDMNGTIAVDGTLVPGVRWRIKKLQEKLKIYLVTADTFGQAQQTAAELGVTMTRVDPLDGGPDKERFLNQLGADKTVAIGNGVNDAALLAGAAVSIVIIGEEGCSVRALQAAHIAVRDIRDALDLLIHEKRLVATLRA